jgi:hypothetical protein
MTKKQSVLLIVALALLGAYVGYFTDWFVSEDIQIIHTLRPFSPSKRGRTAGPNPDANTVSFALNRKFKLTELKVIPVADLETNKYAHPIWHLISESNSVPTKAFIYGSQIRGMHPKVRGARPDPLETNVTYRLFVGAGELKGQHDFKTTVRK